MVRDWRGSLWLSAGLAYGALVACSGGAFTSKSDDGGGSDAGGSTSGKSSTAGKTGASAGTGASSSGGSGGSHAGGASGSANNAGRGGVGGATAGSAGNPMTNGGEASGGSGPVTPSIPTEALVYWFKADAGFIEKSTGSTWKDQSGNERNASQGLAEFSPTLVNETGLGLPVVQFDGTDDLMELPELDLPVDTGISIFAVAGRTADSKCSAVIELSNGPEVDDINLGSLGNTFQYEVYSDSVPGQDNAFPVGELRLLEVLHATTDPDKVLAELRVNGTLTASRAIPAPAKVTRGTNFIGHTLYGDCLSNYAGAIAEIIFYSRKLTTAERVVVEKYLMTRWGL